MADRWKKYRESVRPADGGVREKGQTIHRVAEREKKKVHTMQSVPSHRGGMKNRVTERSVRRASVFGLREEESERIRKGDL